MRFLLIIIMIKFLNSHNFTIIIYIYLKIHIMHSINYQILFLMLIHLFINYLIY